MKIATKNFEIFSGILRQLDLLGKDEYKMITDLSLPRFDFAPQLAIAESVHFHIHVPAVGKLTHSLFEDNGGKVEY